MFQPCQLGCQRVSLGVGRPPSWIYEIKLLTAGIPERRVLHRHAKFCGDRSRCCKDIAIIRAFLAKCKTEIR